MKLALFSFLIALPLAAQTTSVGGIATTPDVTSALQSFIVAHPTATTALAAGSIGIGDSTVQLPSAIASACLESYAVVTLSSASNVSTANVQTYQVPLGTRVTITGSLTSGYNSTFATTSASTTSSGLTFALTIADGTYSNASPSTNGYPVLSYARCAVLVDNEAIGIQGTADGTNYVATRGDLGTTAASHSSGAVITLLPYSQVRGMYRANAQQLIAGVLRTTTTPREQSILSQITALQAQLAALQLINGQ